VICRGWERGDKTYWWCFENLVARDRLSLLKDLVRYSLRGRAAIRHVVLDTEIVVGAARVVAGGEEDTTISLVLADDVGSSRSGEDTVLSDNELLDAVGSTNLENDLDGLGGEISSVTTDDKGLALGVNRIEDRLDEVLCVVLEGPSALFS